MGAVERVGRWWRALVLIAGAVAVIVVTASDGYALIGILVGLALLVGAYLLSPLRAKPSLTHAMAQEQARANGQLIAYWRPGCVHCERLRADLRGERGVLWVDIWQDPEAAAFVREVNDGHELVPTVIAGQAVWPNPGVAKVRAALRGIRAA